MAIAKRKPGIAIAIPFTALLTCLYFGAEPRSVKRNGLAEHTQRVEEAAPAPVANALETKDDEQIVSSLIELNGTQYATEAEAMAAVLEKARAHCAEQKPYCHNVNGLAVVRHPCDTETAEINAQVTEYRESLEEIAKSAGTSSDHAAQFTSGVTATNFDIKTRAFARALELDPTDRPTLWAHYGACVNEGLPGCSPEQLLDAVAQADPHNAETWLSVSLQHYAAGETQNALQSLRRAATSEHASIYFWESVQLFERGMGTAGLSFEERSIGAFGLAASLVAPAYSERLNMCREMAVRSLDWAQTCFDYGEIVEQRDTTYLGQAIALALQAEMADLLPETERTNEARERRDSRQHKFTSFADQTVQETMNAEYALATHPKIWHEYVALGRQRGERAAQRFLIEENERLREQGWMTPCEELAATKPNPTADADAATQ